MKNVSITKSTDSLGRLLLPKELRRTQDIKPGDFLNMYVDGERVILERVDPACALCGSREDLAQCAGGYLCMGCVQGIEKHFYRKAKRR